MPTRPIHIPIILTDLIFHFRRQSPPASWYYHWVDSDGSSHRWRADWYAAAYRPASIRLDSSVTIWMEWIIQGIPHVLHISFDSPASDCSSIENLLGFDLWHIHVAPSPRPEGVSAPPDTRLCPGSNPPQPDCACVCCPHQWSDANADGSPHSAPIVWWLYPVPVPAGDAVPAADRDVPCWRSDAAATVACCVGIPLDGIACGCVAQRHYNHWGTPRAPGRSVWGVPAGGKR